MLANDLDANQPWLMLATIEGNLNCGGYFVPALGNAASALLMPCRTGSKANLTA